MRLLFVCVWLAVAMWAWLGIGAAWEQWQQPLPAPAQPTVSEAPSSGRSPAVPDGGWEQAGCPWRYPTGPCALGGESR